MILEDFQRFLTFLLKAVNGKTVMDHIFYLIKYSIIWYFKSSLNQFQVSSSDNRILEEIILKGHTIWPTTPASGGALNQIPRSFPKQDLDTGGPRSDCPIFLGRFSNLTWEREGFQVLKIIMHPCNYFKASPHPNFLPAMIHMFMNFSKSNCIAMLPNTSFSFRFSYRVPWPLTNTMQWCYILSLGAVALNNHNAVALYSVSPWINWKWC